VLIGAILFFFTRSAESLKESQTISSCNGSATLCDRRVDEVVFPASHNSMSAADIPDWMFPNQEKGIRSQLNEGIRGLLFDVHFGIPALNRIKTSLENEEQSRKKYEKALGKEGVDAAMRVRDRLTGHEEGKMAIYLCHGFCELGATPFDDFLQQIHEFLVTNPSEVLILVIQNEGVTSADLQKAFQNNDLIDFVYKGKAANEWPTLKRLIASEQRLIVTTENWDPGVPWIHSAFQIMQETPYSFKDVSKFSCKPNRGDTSGSLFLMNHWIETVPAPLPSNAKVVNAYDFLLKRAEECRQARGRLPNLLAVDFYATGDLVRVTNKLNGISD